MGQKSYPRYVDLRLAQVRGRVSRCITEFSDHDNVSQLLPDAGCLVDIVNLGSQCRGPQKYVAKSRFAARIGVAVEEGKKESQHAAMLPFASQENSFPGHEAVVKYHIRICGSRQEAAFEVFPGPEGMDGHNLFQSFPVAGDGKGDSIVFVLRPQRSGRPYQYLVSN